MAISLYARICQSDECDYDVPAEMPINIDSFITPMWAILNHTLTGGAGTGHTVSEFKSFHNMDNDQRDEFDVLVALINARTQYEQKILGVLTWQFVLLFHEQSLATPYDTVAEVRTAMLGINT